MSKTLTLSQCKRDALPTELTARALEIGDFSDLTQVVVGGVRGTGRERQEANGTTSPEIVPKERSVVYFVSATNGLVKIGFAADFMDRLGRLVGGSPLPLHPLAIVYGGRVEERNYHDRFKKWKHHGEWFELCPEIQAEIDRINAEERARLGFSTLVTTETAPTPPNSGASSD